MSWASFGSGGKGWLSFCIEAWEIETDEDDDEPSDETGDDLLLSVVARCKAMFAFGVLVLKDLS